MDSTAATGRSRGQAGHVDLTLEGMTCAACATRIERVLNRVPGVQASVNFATESARVDYAGGDVAPLLAAVERAGYHARVRRDVERERALDEARRDAARRALLRDVVVAALLTLPLLLPMVAMAVPALGRSHEDLLPRGWQLLLATPVQLWSGRRFYVGAWHALRGGGANMDVLIALGTTAAYAFSAVVTLLGLPQHVYFEAGATVITLVLLGKLLEARARAGTSAALEGLLRLQPKIAHVLRDGAVRDVPIAEVVVGDRLLVRAGEAFPVDGVVVGGASLVDESMLTGESRPIAKSPDDVAHAGTVNLDGAIELRATGVGAATLLAGIVRLVSQAQGSKAPIQRLADRVSAVFVPVVLVIAVITFAVTFAVLGDGVVALVRAVAVLVIACPCALGLATPAAVIVGTGRAAQLGLLVRDAAALERGAALDVLIVDKTGTLTEGRLAVSAVLPLAGAREADVLALAAALEHGASHPIAQAIRDAGAAAGVSSVEITDFENVAGKGARGRSQGAAVVVGSPTFLVECGIEVRLPDAVSPHATLVGVARDAVLLGWIALVDTVRASASPAVARLRAAGIDVVMVTGDHAGAAAAIAAVAGIERVHAGVLPAGKVDVVEAEKRAGHVVGMVGDGVNDAPALAAADVSFAMASGTDIAIDAADVTLVRADLEALADAVLLARATVRKIRQNLFFAFGYNVLGIPLAALGWLSPVIAGAAMAASSVSVVGNALLLRRFRARRQPRKD